MPQALSWQQLSKVLVSPGKILVQDQPFLPAACKREKDLEVGMRALNQI